MLIIAVSHKTVRSWGHDSISVKSYRLKKIKLFDALDASLHDTTETNAYMADKIITLECQIDYLAESTDSPSK